MSSWWRSRGFVIGSGTAAAFGSAVAYDRYETRRLFNAYLEAARPFGQEAATDLDPPRLLHILLIASHREHSLQSLQLFKKYGTRLLTVAGIDYAYLLKPEDTNAEGLRKAWNAHVKEPEDLREENDSLPQDALVLAVSSALTKAFGGELSAESTPDSAIWRDALETRHPTVSKDNRIELVSLSSLAQQALQTQMNLDRPVVESAPVPASTDWLSRLRGSKAKAPMALPPPELCITSHVPCDLDQRFWPRLTRYLFGQRHVVQTICEPLLAAMKAQ